MRMVWFSALFIGVSLIVLNPYTIYGRPGLIAAAAFSLPAMLSDEAPRYFYKMAIPILTTLVIGLIGVLSSLYNGILQFNHLWAAMSLLFAILASIGIWLSYQKIGADLDDLIFIIFLVFLGNSLLVLIELNFPEVRIVIESHLVEAGNQLYDQGFKFRGIASSGGANLSLTTTAGVVLTIYLTRRRKIHFLMAWIAILVFVVSATVIGRTGLLLMFVPLLIYFLYYWRDLVSLRGLTKLSLFFGFIVVLGAAIYQFLTDYLGDLFGETFIQYSFGFLLEGRSGLEKEGTVSVVLDFMKVLPYEFPQILVGYGFYGDGYFYPWTDSGYARTFLSVGYIFGVIFYFALLYIYLGRGGRYHFVIGALTFLLLLGEAKEPFLISGYVARSLIIISTFHLLDRMRRYRASWIKMESLESRP